MRTLILTSCAALLLATACNSPTKREKSVVDSVTAATTDKPMDSIAIMKAWESYMSPGEAHKMMAKYDGTWDEEVTHWAKPDAPPTVNKATAVNKMILGGRYQQTTHSGNFEGMQFDGLSTLAFDNARKVFISTWVDNMGTGLMYTEGTYDNASKTLTLKGKTYDPSIGKEIEIKEVTKFIDDNNQLMEMFDISNGKEVKSMSIKFARRK